MELIAATGLGRTTTRRMLHGLVELDVLRIDATSRRFRLGVSTQAWGASSLRDAPLLKTAIPPMKALVRKSGENVFLVQSQGDHSLCLHLEESHYMPRGFRASVGGSRLMGLSPGGVAMLAHMDANMREAHILRQQKRYRTRGMSVLQLNQRIQQAEQLGYSMVAQGDLVGLGCAIRFAGCGNAALTIIAPAPRMPSSRRSELASMLRDEARRIEAELHPQVQASNSSL